MSGSAIIGSVNASSVVWGMLGLIALVGLVALVSPRVFRTLAVRSNQWVDTDRVLACLDRRVDIDHHVLPFARPLGFAVLTAVAVIALVYARYGL